MDTTQKETARNRQDVSKRPQNANKRPAQTEKNQQRVSRQAAPASAQQNNGAVRTAQEQRSAGSRAKQQDSQQPVTKQKNTASAKKTTVKKKAPRPQTNLDEISGKKRAYGNSKPKKKSSVAAVGDVFKRSAQQSAEKAKAKKAEKKKARPKQPTPAIIYTEPRAFNRRKLLMQLVTVVAVVAALVMGLSVFFKVETITISGADVYSAWSVREASGISEGDNLLTFSHARAGALIKANLPYVKNVRFGIKLPDTVNIIIEEEDVVYAIKSHDGTWWLMNSEGRVVEQSNGGKAANYTQVLGVTLDNPVVNQKGIATESAAVMETDANGETVPIPVMVTGAQRLTAALQILKALEENDIVGDAASVDVTRIDDIILWYGTRYQVNLGDSARLAYKIACMNDAILQMSDYQSGILDISFTIWPNKVGYTPFA